MRSLRSSSPQPDLGHLATKSLGRLSGRTAWALPPVLALAALVTFAPAASAQGGTNTGGNFDCVAGPPQVIAQFRNPVQIAGTGTLTCPTMGAESPGSFGPGSPRNAPPARPQVGTPCHYEFEEPVRMRVAGATEQYQTFTPRSAGGVPLASDDPADPGIWVSTGWQPLVQFAIGNQANADSMYEQAATLDPFFHWTFDGTWTQVGAQVRCVADPNGATHGWLTPCTQLLGAAPNDCFDFLPPGVPPPASPGLDVGGLGVNLNGFVNGQVFGGVITSLPAPPNPGLTNVPTCFTVSGMTINGRPLDPNQDVFWERIVQGPPDGEGRSVYFVFVIDVRYVDSTWDFGDRSSTLDAPPPECPAVQPPNQQFLVAHVYRSYSTGGGFPVTVNHRFGVDVTEFWNDAGGTHRRDFPGALTVSVPSTPVPYLMPIVQEEGVPVGQGPGNP